MRFPLWLDSFLLKDRCKAPLSYYILQTADCKSGNRLCPEFDIAESGESDQSCKRSQMLNTESGLMRTWIDRSQILRFLQLEPPLMIYSGFTSILFRGQTGRHICRRGFFSASFPLIAGRMPKSSYFTSVDYQESCRISSSLFIKKLSISSLIVVNGRKSGCPNSSIE